MIKKSFLRLFLLFLLALVLMSSCSNDPSNDGIGETNGDDGDGRTYDNMVLSIGTSSEGGLYHTNGSAIAEVFTNSVNGIEAFAEITGGSVENGRLLKSGDAQLGIMSADTSYDLIHGQGVFEGEAWDEFSAIISGHTSQATIVVPEDSPIQTLNDLDSNSTVAWRLEGSSTVENMGQAFFRAYGIDPDKDINSQISSPYADAAQRMRDGRVDMMITFAGQPTPWIVEYTTSDPIRLISLDEGKIDQINEELPFYIPTEIPAGTYDGVDYDTKTIGFLALLAVRDDIPEDVVYELTKALIENSEYAKSITETVAPYVSEDNALLQETVKYHPGAQRYYEEIGIWED